MTLDISIDDFANQREALIQRLAVQYGVDPSLIWLEASAGSVQLTVTITTSDGASNQADFARIQQSIAAANDTALATSIGDVFGTTVSVVSQPPTTADIELEVPFSCPRGTF